MVNPHPENIEIVWRLRGAEHPPDAPPLEVWDATRPAHVEAEAIQRAAFLARTAGASLYAVHVSSAGALEIAARERAAYPGMFIETCPHYLTHDTGSDVGLLGKVNPPLRNAADREALWRGLEAGLIDVVGSDHVPRMKAAKGGDVWKASAGFPGLETLVPVMLSEGCVRRGLPLERVVDLFTCNPARIFGLYPRKGVIAGRLRRGLRDRRLRADADRRRRRASLPGRVLDLRRPAARLRRRAHARARAVRPPRRRAHGREPRRVRRRGGQAAGRRRSSRASGRRRRDDGAVVRTITADDLARYEAAGFGKPSGHGIRPALLIIDVQYRTVGTGRCRSSRRCRSTRRAAARSAGRPSTRSRGS